MAKNFNLEVPKNLMDFTPEILEKAKESKKPIPCKEPSKTVIYEIMRKGFVVVSTSGYPGIVWLEKSPSWS